MCEPCVSRLSPPAGDEKLPRYCHERAELHLLVDQVPVVYLSVLINLVQCVLAPPSRGPCKVVALIMASSSFF